MKRLTALFLALVMLVGMTCTASAENAVTVTVGDVKGEIGDIVQVPVSVSEGHYMVNGRIFLTYDPTVLELQEVCDDEDNPYFENVNTDILDRTFMWMFAAPEAGRANFVFVTSSDSGNAAGGAIYTLTFKVLKETQSTITATVEEMQVNSGAGDTMIVPTVVDGKVNVTPVVRGDVNSDGAVDLNDATRLFYYVNGLLTLTDKQMASAELTGDGEVNLDDASRLFYYIAGMMDL